MWYGTCSFCFVFCVVGLRYHSNMTFNLEAWLTSNKLSQYISNFKKADYVELTACMDLTDEDLNELGITSPGHRKQLKALSASLKENSNSINYPTTPVQQKKPVQAQSSASKLKSTGMFVLFIYSFCACLYALFFFCFIF